MSILKTDYKDDVINTELAADRKFGEVANEDGTFSYNDVTPYTQEGDEYGAKEINHENTHTNYAIEAADHTYQGVDLTVRFAEEIAGYANAWRWIKARIAAANFDGLHIGDYIPIYMGDYLIKMQIAGMDTYYKTTDRQLGHHIDWISEKCYPESVQWDTDNNNGTANSRTPYIRSKVKTFLDGLVVKLPNELFEVISTKRFLLETRYSDSGILKDSTSWIWSDLGKLWLPSEYEVFGSIIWGTKPFSAGQAVQYPIFANTEINRIKGDNWWLLTVGSGDNLTACMVSKHGVADMTVCKREEHVPICFRISE
nr:DUF6273 domain-containing protein [uncultured Lachnoclostridium sp.]